MDKLIAFAVVFIIALLLSVAFFFGFKYLRNRREKVYKAFSIVSITLAMVCVAFVLYGLVNMLIWCFSIVL